MLLHAILSQKCELGEGVECPPAMEGGRVTARSPMVGAVVEVAEVRVSGFLGFHDH